MKNFSKSQIYTIGMVIVFTVIILVGIDITTVFAQPPGLPSTPTQAPIDGGLGLLAAAGGAYAIKKLRAKKE